MLSAMDVFIMPSLYEGLPVSALEAQAAGLPTVLSDRITKETAVIPELVKFVPLEKEPELWTRTILNCLRIDSLAGELREQKFDLLGFSISASMRNLLDKYAKLLSMKIGPLQMVEKDF